MQAVIKNASQRPCRIFMLRPPVNRGSIAPGVLSTNRQARVGCASKMIRVQHANSSAHMEILRHVWFSAVPLGFRPLPFSQYLLTQTHTRSVLYISLSHTRTLSLFSIKRAKDVKNCIFSNQLACGLTEQLVDQCVSKKADLSSPDPNQTHVSKGHLRKTRSYVQKCLYGVQHRETENGS